MAARHPATWCTFLPLGGIHPKLFGFLCLFCLPLHGNYGLPDLGDVKFGVDAHGPGKSEFDCDWVDYPLDGEWTYEPWGQLLALDTKRKVLSGQPDLLSQLVHQGLGASTVGRLAIVVTGALRAFLQVRWQWQTKACTDGQGASSSSNENKGGW